jgi:hypothetical protein
MPGTTMKKNPKLEAVYDVFIDDGGRFKYILCKVSDPEKPDDFKMIIRGTKTADFHCKFNILLFKLYFILLVK